MLSAAVVALALAATGVHAAVTPTAPSPGQTFNEGSTCTMQWDVDTTGTWTDMRIDLMTGSNLAMVLVENVATDLDGTTLSTYSWPCPEVTPNSAIYFYQFSNGDNTTALFWTTRFGVCSASGVCVAPQHSTQVDSTGATIAVPWGTGEVVGAAASQPAAAVSGSVTAAGSSAVAEASSVAAEATSAAASAVAGVTTGFTTVSSTTPSSSSTPSSGSATSSASSSSSSSTAASSSKSGAARTLGVDSCSAAVALALVAGAAAFLA